MNKKWTKWRPLYSYIHGYSSHCIIFARMNRKTGMLYFKNKTVNGHFHPFSDSCITINSQEIFDKLVRDK